MPSPNLKQRDSPLSRPRGSPGRSKSPLTVSKPLRSPRGSPRGARQTPYLTSQHFRCVLLCSFPFLLLLQSSITFTSSHFDFHHDKLPALGSFDAPHRPSKVNKERLSPPPTSKQQSELSYSYADNPVVPSGMYTPHSHTPLPVVLLGSTQTKDSKEGTLLDGLERSRYVKVIRDKKDWLSLKESPNQTVVHMVDWGAIDRDCHVLEEMYSNVIQPASHLLVYFDQTASTRVVSCPTINSLFHNQYRIIKQSIVRGRHWDSKKQWVKKGRIMENTEQGSGPVLHSPHFLRESFVDLILEAMEASGQSLSQIVSHPRKLDVVHVWRKGDSSHYGRLRRQVSLAIQQLDGTKIKKHSLRWLVRPQGNDDELEQGTVQPEYVANLISSKIVVVAQRDEWEDHFRLMESLASGALVLTDEMLAAPHGLKNGTNVIVYRDVQSLQNMILHFAHPDNEEERKAIAQKGFNLAMGKHRSWHRMEQLLFGAARSLVYKPLSPAPSRRSQTIQGTRTLEE
jgi:hypothetical protein